LKGTANSRYHGQIFLFLFNKLIILKN